MSDIKTHESWSSTRDVRLKHITCVCNKTGVDNRPGMRNEKREHVKNFTKEAHTM